MNREITPDDKAQQPAVEPRAVEHKHESEPAHEHEYVLGTHEDELHRLGFQHQVWAPQTTRLWELARFAPGAQLLDLGSGPGYATADLAQLVGVEGHISAVDVSRRFLLSLQQLIAARVLNNVSWHEADAASLPHESGTLDGAFARWLLCFTPDAQAVVHEVARVLKPGGRFVIMDYANYEALTMAPTSAAIEHVIQVTAESVRQRGGSFAVGRELPTMLHAAGFDVEHIEPIVRVARPSSALWNWPASFFRNYLPTLLSLGLITDLESDAFVHAWEERSRDPSAYLITPTMVGIVGVKR